MARNSILRKAIPALFVLVAICTSPASAQRVPPDESWRTLETEHFRVTFPERLEDLARRAADRAEWAHATLSDQFVQGPQGTIDLVVTDHTDVSNGYATPFPSNRIVLYARPPVDSFLLGNFDDWMELLIVHELTHIFHLDRRGRYSLRGLFGRIPVPVFGFPAITTPLWVIEGIATWYESALTGEGRVLGTYHNMVLRTAALEGRFESIGQAGGWSPQWPGGLRVYIYGSMFFEHLMRKYGRERMSAFVKAVEGQWIPYRLDAAGRSAFGASLSSEWTAWANDWKTEAAELDARLSRFGAISEPERLTGGARYALYPRVSPDGSALFYRRSDGRSDPRLTSIALNGGAESTVARIRGGRFAFTPGGDVLVAQLESSGRYRLFSDVYRVTRDGAMDRLTNGARLTAPSAGPDERAVAVSEGEGASGLDRVDTRTGAVETLVRPEAGVHWAFPAVSPDGQWIAATRWEGGHHDVVILDAGGGLVSRVTEDRALDFAPAWSAGGRWLLWSSDRTGILNVFAARVDSGRAGPPVMLTNVRTGAAWPSVDPSGQWLYFSGYHADGWEIERMPFNPAAAPPAPRYTADSTHTAAGMTAAQVASAVEERRVRAGGPARDYSPSSTLGPRYWLPYGTLSLSGAGNGASSRTKALGGSIGGLTSGVDLVGRHAYSVGARIYLPAGGYSGGRGAGFLSYRYYGLGDPALGLSLSQNWDEERVRVRERNGGAAADTMFILERARRAFVSTTFARPRVWRAISVTLSGGLLREDREALDTGLRPADLSKFDSPHSTLGEIAAGFSATTARTHAFQMGGAAGASFSIRATRRIDLAKEPSDDRSVDAVTGDFRTYAKLPGGGFAAPVLALRASAGEARGPDSGRGYFQVGGVSRRLFPVRGYESTQRSGRRAWTASLELRLPAALVNRAIRTPLLHFDRAFLTLFADAGNAWGRDYSSQNTPEPLLSAGAEIVYDFGVLYVPIRFRAGAGYGFTDPKGAVPYLLLGTSF
ncbi:MAG: hypothetical protein OXU79_20325 [Gemmatimonadota bacterium]|nr:hypothetical protein [Gemmatimonadota bacterium]